MTRPIARLIIAAIFVVAGGLCWTARAVSERLAARHERLALLQTSESTASSRWTVWLENVVSAALTDADHSRPLPTNLAADYWAGRYEAVASSNASKQADASLLLASANAVFRKAQREAGSRSPSVERLDQVLQGYAGALKDGGFNRDAAYNYEYVARLRDGIARSRTQPAPRQVPPRTRTASADDLPAGPTVHGTRGTHPPGTKGEEFEIMTPMDYGEREAQPEATPGRPLPRKG